MKHIELDKAAMDIAKKAVVSINKAAMEIKDKDMPYKAQYVLEEVVRILKDLI